MCDAPSTPCVTDLLFAHEFDWPASHPHWSASRCRSWRQDGDWPTSEPHLLRSGYKRKGVQMRARPFWDVLQLFPNQTLWIHGDSVQVQLCSAALCSLMRNAPVSQPLLTPRGRRPAWIESLETSTSYPFRTTLLANGARLLCSGMGPYEEGRIAKVLKHVDVAIINHGLHYHTSLDVANMLNSAFQLLKTWDRRSQHHVSLWREASVQHFVHGSYTPGAEIVEGQLTPGKPCRCHALNELSNGTETLRAVLAFDPGVENRTNLNFFTAALERRLALQHGIKLVPFFNVTAPRHDMHNAHYCAYHYQKANPTDCCDCTHFCYTPLFWDTVFGSLYSAARRVLKRQGRWGWI